MLMIQPELNPGLQVEMPTVQQQRSCVTNMSECLLIYLTQ
jgi:hypothetical protein